MSISSQEFETFFKFAHGIENVTSSTKSGLKCFKCGKTLKMNSTKTKLECVSGDISHERAFFDYMIDYTDCFKGLIGAIELPLELIAKSINPNGTLYVKNMAIYVNNKIIKA